MPDLQQILDELKDKTIIVEGKKDERALKDLGIEHIVPINSKPLIAIVQGISDVMTAPERTSRKEVVILTDFDKQGRKLNARLLPLLQRHKIPTNPRLRHMMRGFGKTRIEDFQSFTGDGVALENKEGDTYGETRANINQVYHQRKNQSKRSHRKT